MRARKADWVFRGSPGKSGGSRGVFRLVVRTYVLLVVALRLNLNHNA